MNKNINNHSGHENHENHKNMIDEFKKKFFISLILSIPVIIFDPMIQMLFNYSVNIPYQNYIQFLLSTFIFIYCGSPFLLGAKKEIQNKNMGMMTLIALAITTAYLYSSLIAFGFKGNSFFWELVTLISIMLLGHWIEMQSTMGASRSLELLVELLPSIAHRIINNNEVEDVQLHSLKKDDILLIKANEKIPADGLIIRGDTYINESMLTGESEPVYKTIKDNVIAGSINGKNSIEISITNHGKNSYINKLIIMVKEAQNSKSKTQTLANIAAKWLTYIAIWIGFGTFVYWLLAGQEISFSLERMVTVMIITCPHALGLAIPLVTANSTAIAAKNGILIRNRNAFENSRKISTIVFDKTGTLTKGEFGVNIYRSLTDHYNDTDIFILAASLEKFSEHPLAEGILKEFKKQNLTFLNVDTFESITGKGVQGIINGLSIKAMSPNYLKENKIPIPENLTINSIDTVIYIFINNELSGYITLSDQIRDDSEKAVKLLKEKGIKVFMATGDNKRVAKFISDKLNLDGFFAEVYPEEKVNIIKNLKKNGEFIAMTGDGVNDAPALAQADIGIAVGSGTDIAAETADIILVNSEIKDIVKLIFFGRETYNKMIQNLIWATGYNVVAIPLAAGIFYPKFTLNPAIGAIFMTLSTVIVAINAELLKNKINIFNK